MKKFENKKWTKARYLPLLQDFFLFIFSNAQSKFSIIFLQTDAISQFLKDPSGIRFMPNEILESFVKHVVDKFTAYTSNHSFTELQCQEIEEIRPSVETIVAFDGAWSQGDTADFLA